MTTKLVYPGMDLYAFSEKIHYFNRHLLNIYCIVQNFKCSLCENQTVNPLV